MHLEAINKELSRHESNSQQAIIMELSCEESCCSAGEYQAYEQAVSRGSVAEYQVDERAGVARLSWRVSGR